MLDESDLLKIQEMIVGVVSKLTPPIKQKRKYTKRKKKTVAKKQKAVVDLDIEETPDTIEEEPSQPQRVRRVKKQDVEQKRGGDKGRQARVEPFRPVRNRPNNFLKSADAKLFKKDSRIDKKLSGDVEPTPRRTNANLVEAECISCGDVYEVSTKEILRDAETGEARWKCNNCIRR